MRILRSYILRECIFPFFLALGVLTCVFLLGNLIQLANLVINKGVSIATVGKVFLLYIPLLLGYTLPIACLVSIILAFSRMSADNEILAIRTCGVHLRRILFPLLMIGIVFSLISVILNEKIVPYAHHEQRKILKKLGSQNPTALLEAGLFIHAFKGQILFIHKIEDNHMYNVTIYQPQPEGRPTRTIIAKEGEFTTVPGKETIKLKLMNGSSDEPNLKDPTSFYKLNFNTYFMTLDLSNKDKKIEKKPRSMTLEELQAETMRLQALGVDTTRFDTEYYRKITWSFSPLFFVFLGFPIAVITHKRERTVNVVLAIFCAAIYYLLSLGCEALAIERIVDVELIMWTPNIVLGLLAFYLNAKLCAS